MIYMKVEWAHDDPAYPICLYSELNEQRWEIRKVEGFKDGSWSYADQGEAKGESRIGERPVPSMEEIAATPEFHPQLITKEEFEIVFETARRRVSPRPGGQQWESRELPRRRA